MRRLHEIVGHTKPKRRPVVKCWHCGCVLGWREGRKEFVGSRSATPVRKREYVANVLALDPNELDASKLKPGSYRHSLEYADGTRYRVACIKCGEVTQV